MEENTIQAPEMEANEVVENKAASTEVAEDSSSDNTHNNAVDEQENTPFPKKAVNALSRRDKTIGKLRAEQQRLISELNEMKSSSTNNKPKDDPPNEDDFDTYGDYLKAVTKHEIKQSLAENENNKKEVSLKRQQTENDQRIRQERAEIVSKQSDDYRKSIPDFSSIVESNIDIVNSFSEEIQSLFMEADNAPMAFYALAKEGKLEMISNLSPTMAAMEIGRAIDRGVAMTSKTNTINTTQAPRPMSGVNGTKGGSKSPADMNADEIVKWALG